MSLAEWNGVAPSMVQLPPPSGGKKGTDVSWVIKCKLCNGVTLESRTTWQQHFESKRHRNAARQQGLTATGHRLVDAPPTPNTTATTAEAVAGGNHHGKPPPAAAMGGPPVPRSKASPNTPNNNGSGGGEFDIAKSIASQVGTKTAPGGGGASAAAGGNASNGKTIMPRPNNQQKAGGGPVAAAAGGGWANPPTSVTSSSTTGKQQQQQQAGGGGSKKNAENTTTVVKAASKPNSTNTTNATGNSSSTGGAAASRQKHTSTVLLNDNVVNRDRVRTPTPAAETATAAVVAIPAAADPPPPVRVTVGAPLVDPALDRTKGRTLAFLNGASRPVVLGVPVAATSSELQQQQLFKVTARLPVSLYRLLVPRGDDLDAMRAPAAPATTETVKAFRESFHELASEFGSFDTVPDAPGVTLLTASRPVPIATLRLAESFFSAAVCFAPYDEPAGPTATAAAARVDTASFWS